MQEARAASALVKMSTVLLEVSTGKITPLLSHPVESVTINGFFSGDWAIVRRDIPNDGKLPTHSIALWRDGGLAPQSEWVPFERPAPTWNYSPSQPLLYGFQDSQLVARRFDPKTRRFSNVFPVKIPSGGPVEFQPSDAWSVRALGSCSHGGRPRGRCGR